MVGSVKEISGHPYAFVLNAGIKKGTPLINLALRQGVQSAAHQCLGNKLKELSGVGNAGWKSKYLYGIKYPERIST
jgi:hypothetical protein